MRHSRHVVWSNYDFLGLLNGRFETLQECETLVSKFEPETLITENFEFEIMLQIKLHKISELKEPMPIEAYKSPLFNKVHSVVDVSMNAEKIDP